MPDGFAEQLVHRVSLSGEAGAVRLQLHSGGHFSGQDALGRWPEDLGFTTRMCEGSVMK
ncbi:hypothetical protein OG336_33325 [[Kitasatospora] papulosa]|uniref:hypothetical protein n=1 Tax=[Kitasatospora] papulosa TaxID=1464011 RepID=UPI002E167E03|nr:hypothetical protein OG336_33325 [[Kitasatospora] papulosa]